ncbi:MAG: hypothetical protein GX589_00590 [Deltaproteobacteria bacterium]|nr:hypothetical protein [Deltaproteobacteria bacterium]
MRSWSLPLIMAVILSCLFFGAVSEMRFAPAAAAAHTEVVALSKWHPEINLSHNAYYSWRLDPLLAYVESAVASLWGGEFSLQSHLILLLLFLCSGLYVWLNYLDCSTARILGACLSALFLLFVLFLWGQDAVIIGSLVWLPWLALVASKAQAAGSNCSKSMFFLLLVSCLNALSANQLSIITAIAALVAAAGSAPNSACVGVRRWVWALALIPPFLVLQVTPLPPFPDYPPLAHVVSLTGVRGWVRPLVGDQTFPIDVIDQIFIKSAYRTLCLLLFLAFLVVVIRSALESRGDCASNSRATFFLRAGAVTVVLVALDVLVPQTISVAAPLATINRLSPALFQLPLVPVVLALSLFFAVSYVQLSRNMVLLVMIFLSVGFLSYDAKAPEGYVWRMGFLQKKNALSAWQDRRAARYKHILLSPSYSLINSYGVSLLDDQAIFTAPVFRDIDFDGVIFSDSNGARGGDLFRLQPENEGKRWIAHHGGQRGDEWLHVYFPKLLKIRGVELFTGEFKADFPRGVEVLISRSCVAEVDDFGSYDQILDMPIWQGSVQFSAKGYPYYGAQAEVKLIFPAPVETRCLLIKQTGHSPYYEWSLTGFRLLY